MLEAIDGPQVQDIFSFLRVDFNLRTGYWIFSKSAGCITRSERICGLY